jgi:tRNA-2-methylthio-N6-dimethylallyladenosine synthase
MLENILREVEHLAKRGFKEITLCGQNVNSWGLSMSEKFEIRTGSEQKLPFADLLRKVHDITEVEKIGFISSNPFDFTQDLIEALKLPKISNYLHIAAQSGNNEVLKRMNRRHTIEDFYKLMGEIKAAKPEVEFGTDIIVGFPGETREQFMDTVRLFETVKFNVAYISIYSPRKGTPAERFFADDVDRTEKKWRHEYLSKVWKNTKK